MADTEAVNSARSPASRLADHIEIGTAEDPRQRDILRQAIFRIALTATGKELISLFLAESIPARVVFRPLAASSTPTDYVSRVSFAMRGETKWAEGRVCVSLAQKYLADDGANLDVELAVTLTHELLGHGLWYARAARENVVQGYHHHELNETYARHVGWLVGLELDKDADASDARQYVADPARYMAELKLQEIYYSMIFSGEEMLHPTETLERRLHTIDIRINDLRESLADQLNWLSVIDHFVHAHGIPDERVEELRDDVRATELTIRSNLLKAQRISGEIRETIERLYSEEDKVSEKYLRWAAAHPMFKDLQQEVAGKFERLLQEVDRRPTIVAPEMSVLSGERKRWDGQVTFAELVNMYERDRMENPGHWVR